MRPYVPGESLESLQHRYGLSSIVKLNANENPRGSSPRAAEALRELQNLHLYGDDANTLLRTSIGARMGLGPECVVLGHGSNELIALAGAVFLLPGDRAIMGRPSFSLFRVAADVNKAKAVEIPLQEGRYDIDGMLAAITENTKILFVCDPNNPTGTALETSQWATLLDGLPESVLLVLDQAYIEYAGRPSIDAKQLLQRRSKTLVLRTMSKIYGLASLRFGYGYADQQTIAVLNARRVPYNVSRPAAAAASAALEDEQFVKETLEVNAAGKALLTSALRSLGLHVMESHTNFLSVGVPVPADRASARRTWTVGS